MNNLYLEYIIPSKIGTVPFSIFGMFRYKGKAPKHHLTPSESNNIRANVAKT